MQVFLMVQERHSYIREKFRFGKKPRVVEGKELNKMTDIAMYD